MKFLTSIAVLLLTVGVCLGQTTKNNYYTTNANPTLSPAAVAINATNREYNIRNFGVAADMKVVRRVAITSGSRTLTTVNGTFTSADIGKGISIWGAGTSSNNLQSIITNIISGTSVMISNPAVLTVSVASAVYGTDDTAALRTWMATLNTYKDATFTFPGMCFVAGVPQDVGQNWTHRNAILFLPDMSYAGTAAPRLTFRGVTRVSSSGIDAELPSDVSIPGAGIFFAYPKGPNGWTNMVSGLDCRNFNTPVAISIKQDGDERWPMNAGKLRLDDMCFVAPFDNNYAIVNLAGMNTAEVEGCYISDGLSHVAHPQLTGTNGYGIFMPGNFCEPGNTFSHNTIRGVYYGANFTGLVTGEDNYFSACFVAMAFLHGGGHPTLLQGNTMALCKNIFANGPDGNEFIGSVYIEATANDWTGDPNLLTLPATASLSGKVLIEVTGDFVDIPIANLPSASGLQVEQIQNSVNPRILTPFETGGNPAWKHTMSAASGGSFLWRIHDFDESTRWLIGSDLSGDANHSSGFHFRPNGTVFTKAFVMGTNGNFTLNNGRFIGNAGGATNITPSTGLAASGTPSATTFLRGDNSWATPSSALSGSAITNFDVGRSFTNFDTSFVVQGKAFFIADMYLQSLLQINGTLYNQDNSQVAVFSNSLLSRAVIITNGVVFWGTNVNTSNYGSNNTAGLIFPTNMQARSFASTGSITNGSQTFWLGTGVAPVALSNGVNGLNAIGPQAGLTNVAAKALSLSGNLSWGTSSGTAMLKPNGAEVQTRLGDDSGLAGSQASYYQAASRIAISANGTDANLVTFNSSPLKIIFNNASTVATMTSGTAWNFEPGVIVTVASAITSSNATLSKITVPSGANSRAGNATLVGGTVTVNNTTVTANTVVMLTRKTSGGTIGTAITYTLSAATSFTINSDNILDTSTFSYFLIENP